MVWWDEREELASCSAALANPVKHDDPGLQHTSATSRSPMDRAAMPSAEAATENGKQLQPCGVEHRRLTATVDLECEYVRQLVIDSFARRPDWFVTVVEGQDDVVHPDALTSDFHWAEYERIDWERVHSGSQASSSYCVRKGLIRKAHLAHNLQKWAAKHKGSALAAATPETHILDVDDVEYIDEALSDLPEVRDMEPGSAVWIMKPSLTNQGAGITIIDSCAALRAALVDAPDLREWVVQRYIERPLLVDGRKFHIRAYALCVGSLQVYVYSEMLALFAAQPYGTAGLTDLEAHLTNTCCQSDSGLREEDLVRLLSELPEVVSGGEATAERVRQLHDSVRAVIGECMEAVSAELTFFTLPNCFELFGFDLLADDEWHLWLLEANAEPDFLQTGSRLKSLVAGVVEGTMQLVVDPLADALLKDHGLMSHCGSYTAAAAAAAAPDFSHCSPAVSSSIAAAAAGTQSQQSTGRSLLHGGEDHDEAVAADEDASEVAVTVGRSYTWLKWVAAAVLFVEAYVGVALPYLLRITPRGQWLLSLANAFAGGAFFTFGIMHLLMDSVGAQEDVNFTRWPIAGFFVGIGFFTFFFLQKVLAPSLGLGHTHNARVSTTDGDAETGLDVESDCGGTSAKTCCKEGPTHCACGTPAEVPTAGRPEKANLIVEGCGCNGDCDDSCGPNCSCAAAKKAGVTAYDSVKALREPYLAPGVGQPRSSSGRFRWDLVSPVLVMLGVLVHAILEGLAIGLSHTYGDVVTAFIAMATHKWVESVAISARFLKAGASMTALVSFLLPFSIGPLIGIIIGVKVANDSSWSDLVLFGFVAGLFIYVGTCEITAEEFAALDTPEGRVGKPKSARFWLFGALFFGFTVVALLQLVPGN